MGSGQFKIFPVALFEKNRFFTPYHNSGGGGWFDQICYHGNVNISSTEQARIVGLVSFESIFQVD